MNSDAGLRETEIGLIPEDWNIKPLPNILSHTVDNRGKSAPLSEIGIPLIATNCIKENGLYPTYEKIRFVSKETYHTWFRDHPQPNDIIIVNKGTPGLVCLVPDPVDFCIAQDMVAIRADKNKIYDKYLFAYLRSPIFKYQVDGINVGTTIPHLKKTWFSKLLIPIPPYSEQKFIGDTYYGLSKKIELNYRTNETLEEIARAIFRNWFVNFEFPNENGQPYKSSGGKMMDSDLGEIPVGWKVGNIYKLCDVVYGASFSSKFFNENKEGLPLIRIRDLKKSKTGFFTTEKHPKGTIINPGDIIAGMDAEFTPYFWLGNKGWMNQRICMFVPKYPYIHKFFIYQTVKIPLKFYENSKVGTTVIHLSKSDIDRFMVIIPSSELQKKFNKIIDPIFKRIVLNAQNMEFMRKIRDSLLPKLISGKIRVKKSVEEAEI